jgi:ABC-type multidrug transport system fused ATPase/permease subunit
MNLELKRLNSKEGYQKLDESSTEDDSEIIVVSESDIEKNKEEEEDRLRRLNIKQLSSKEIIIKSTKISLKNWRKSVYNQVELFFTQIFSMYLPILKAKIIDAISSNRNYEELFSRFKTYFFFLLLQLIIEEIMELFEYYFIRSSNNQYKDLLLEQIVKKDISFFDIFKTGELIEKIDKCEENIQEDFIFKTISCIQNLLKLLLMSYYLYVTSFRLTLVLLIVFLCKLITDYLSEKYSIFSDFDNILKLTEKYSNSLNELISNIRMIKSFGKEEEEVKKLKHLKRLISFDLNIITTILLKLSSLVEKGGEAITLFFAGKYILEKKFTLGKFTVFQQYQDEFSDCYGEIKNIIKEYKKLIENWKLFFELYDYPILIKSTINYIPNKLIGKIKFDNVTFSYPLKPLVNVLNNLSFEIEPGTIFAICGFSGSGKTTISHLLQRFYDPNKGKILIDDVDMKDYNINFLRENIGLVSQEPILNSGTIEENITYGVFSYKKSDFDEVLKLSNINTFINDTNLFPDGIKTLVGERGIKISGGQKQRIAIARALIKKAKILIFDEATSALDAESEGEVQKAIDNIVKSKGITTIIIAHRLSTIINADKIAVLDKGNVVEIGNHKELIEKNGEYKKLFQKQLVYEKKKSKEEVKGNIEEEALDEEKDEDVVLNDDKNEEDD